MQALKQERNRTAEEQRKAVEALESKTNTATRDRDARTARRTALEAQNNSNISTTVNGDASKKVHIDALKQIDAAIQKITTLSEGQNNQGDYAKFTTMTANLKTAVDNVDPDIYGALMSMKFGFYETGGAENKKTINDPNTTVETLAKIKKNLQNLNDLNTKGPLRSVVMTTLFASVLKFLANKLTLIRSKKEEELEKMKQSNNANQEELKRLKAAANAAKKAAENANAAASTAAATKIQAVFRGGQVRKELKNKTGLAGAQELNKAAMEFIMLLNSLVQKPANAEAVEGKVAPAAASGNTVNSLLEQLNDSPPLANVNALKNRLKKALKNQFGINGPQTFDAKRANLGKKANRIAALTGYAQ